ncbi:MAG: WD40 repeat domain-containing protein [Myxococcota bacterium]
MPPIASSYRLALGLSAVCALSSAACRTSGAPAPTSPPEPDVAAAPRPDDSGPAAEPTAAAETPPAAKVEEAVEAPPPRPTFAFAWGQDTDDWNNAIAVAPSGWVLSAGRNNLRVLASDDGRILQSARTCYVADNGLRIVSDTEGLILCGSGEIRTLEFPTLAQKVVGKVGSRDIEVVGWGRSLVALGSRKGAVHIVDTKTLKEVDSFTVPDEVEGVAVAPDDRWVAAGEEEGGTFIHDMATKATRELVRTDRRPTAMAASPDGTRLFVQDGSFEARIYDVGSGEVVGTHGCGSWLTGATWLAPDLIAATGSDGFVLYSAGEKEGKSLDDPKAEKYRTGEWLGASADNTIACAGDRDGRISCFSTAAMPASTYVPAVAEAGDDPAAGGDPAAVGPLLEGTIESRKGKTVRVRASSDARPAVGTKGSMSRHFERQMGRMTMSGWMGIATVEVTKVSGKTVTLKILEETSNVVINGRKQNQFKKGFQVKVEPGE